MKRLILSGALLLCAATSCTGAKAAWNEVAGSRKGERSNATGTQGPGGYTGPAEDWKVTNAAVPTNNTGNNEVGFKAWVLNGPGDDYPIWDSQLYTGASLIASFKWNNVGVRPDNSTVSHTADFSGNLNVNLPAGTSNPAQSYTGVYYEVFPVDWNTQADPEKGTYWVAAVPGAGGTVRYLHYVNGAWVAGPGNRPIRQAVQGSRVASTPASTTTQSVEVRIKGYVKSIGTGVPNGTVYSEASGSIRSIGISMQP